MRVSTRHLRHITLQLALPPSEPDRLPVWAKRAAAEIRTQLPPGHVALTGHLRCTLRAGIVDHQRELTRATLPLLELLAHERVTCGSITDLDAKWDRTIEAGRVRLQIATTTAPLQRLPASARYRAGQASRARRISGESANRSATGA